jgi:hypothetical protein
MKFLIASFGMLVISISIVQSTVWAQTEGPKSWSCAYGDYHITLRAPEGIGNFNFRICEFYTCDPSTLLQGARLVSSVPKEGKYTYETPNVSAEERLILKYNDKQTLEEIELTIAGSLVGFFDYCTAI